MAINVDPTVKTALEVALGSFTDDEEKYIRRIIAKIYKSKNGERFKLMYKDGCMDAIYQSMPDGYEKNIIEVCRTLAFWFAGDRRFIAEAFRLSSMCVDITATEWEEESFRNRIIDEAIEQCDGHFWEEPKQQIKQRLTIEALTDILNDDGISIRLNLITNSIEISGYSETESAQHIYDTLTTLLYDKLVEDYKGVTIDIIDRYIFAIATRDRYNPVLDYFKYVIWDGKNRITDLCDILHIDHEDGLSQTLLYKWLKQGWALLNNDISAPFGADGALTLTGKQGIGKTTFFRKLAVKPQWFRDGQTLDDRDKDTRRRIVTTWIAELGELDATFKKSDVAMLKSFITSDIDEYRLSYGRKDRQSPRHVNLCATVNDTRFLVDTTGNRRFWTIPVNAIDLDALNKFDVIQLWAQVRDDWTNSDPQCFRLTPDEQRQLAERNAEHEKLIPSEAEVIELLEMTPKPNTKQKIEWRNAPVTEWMDENEVIGRYTVEQVGRALTKHKVEATLTKIEGKTVRLRYLPFRVYPK